MMKTPLDSDALENIIRPFDSDERVVPLAGQEIRSPLSLADSIMLHARLERAATLRVA